MTAFVENLIDAVGDAAKTTARTQRGRPKARRLLSTLRGKRRILVTCHKHPDPDALGSAVALRHLLRERLPDLADGSRPVVEASGIGETAAGINAAFTRHAKLDLATWRPERLTNPATQDAYDAVVLCDVQPSFAYSPLPEGVAATAIIDHHRARGRRPVAPFVDIRTDVGATASIVFGYFMELDVEPTPDLAATMLYAIESDLAGAAGTPSDLDNAALSTLTALADTRRLYRMRHVDLPQHYFVSYARGLNDAQLYGPLLVTHIGRIVHLEKPAVIADFLLRYEAAEWAIVTATAADDLQAERPDRLIVSARTRSSELSAGEAMRRAIRGLGEGGGHRAKAGGVIRLENGTPTEIDRVRLAFRRKFLRALRLPHDQRGRSLMDEGC